MTSGHVRDEPADDCPCLDQPGRKDCPWQYVNSKFDRAFEPVLVYFFAGGEQLPIDM